MDKLSAIVAFISVAEMGSFTLAAQRLSLPKSRVSQRIKDLENELNVRLFERSTRVVRITAAGNVYLAECKTLLSHLSCVEKNLKGDRDALTGKITIDALMPFTRWVIAPFINEFDLRYPEIHLNLKCSDNIVNVFQENVDLVIRGGILEDSSLIVRPLCLIPFQLYAPPWIAQRLKDKKNLSELLNYQLLSWFPEDEAEVRWTLHNNNESDHIRSKTHTFVSDQDVALQIASAGHGVCPGMYLAADRFVRQGLLVPVMTNWMMAPRQVSILYPSKTHLPRKVVMFIEWMSETVKQIDFSQNHAS